jgi:alpha-glucoside transport system permease protein
LGTVPEQMVLAAKLDALPGSRGGNWGDADDIGFRSIIVPQIVLFPLQCCFVPGCLPAR